MTTLPAFLLARYREREDAARSCRGWRECEPDACPAHPELADVVADLEAKRKLVELADPGVLRILARPFISHPDFRERWRP